jgi:uncharacterized protein YdeI (BOF family)
MMKTTKIQLTAMAILMMVFMVTTSAASSNGNKTEIEITKISALERYTTTHIKGEVVRLLNEDEFRLQDESGRIKVYVGWKNPGVVKKGDVITVKGMMDPGIFFDEFYASEIIMENGNVIKLKSGDQ